LITRRITLTAMAVGLARAPAEAQAVLTFPGKTVEVIGLRRWTIPMVQDSLAKYAPGITLDSHACAQALRYKLGFADAAVMSYQTPGDSLETVLVIVVEPQDSARVQYRPAPLDSARPRAAWRPLLRVIREKPPAFQTALWQYRAWELDPHVALPPWAARDSTEIRAVWRFLAGQRRSAHLETAIRVLRTDSNVYDRIAAAAILANFTDQDRALHALVGALLESDGPVKGIASIVLESFSQERPRPVDWRPVAAELHAILNGTDLFALSATMRLLVATGVHSDLAPSLLRGGGEMVLSFLTAQHPDPRLSAHALLVALRGTDLGFDINPWREWIRSL